jgi:hypothetical protein
MNGLTDNQAGDECARSKGKAFEEGLHRARYSSVLEKRSMMRWCISLALGLRLVWRGGNLVN